MKHLPSGLRVPVLLIVSIAFATVSPATIYAGETPSPGQNPKHIASSGEVRAAVTSVAAVRGAQIDKIAAALASGTAQRRLASWGISVDQVKGAVSRLDDSELAALAARADAALAQLEGEGNNLWLIAGIAAAVVLAICVYLLATTEY